MPRGRDCAIRIGTRRIDVRNTRANITRHRIAAPSFTSSMNQLAQILDPEHWAPRLYRSRALQDQFQHVTLRSLAGWSPVQTESHFRGNFRLGGNSTAIILFSTDWCLAHFNECARVVRMARM